MARMIPGPPPSDAGQRQFTARTRVVRWLMDPVVSVPQDLRQPLIAAIDVTLFGVVTSFVNFVFLNMLCWRLAGGRLFAVLLAANLLLGGARVASAFVVGGRAPGRPVTIDAYILLSLSWCVMQGALGGAAELTNNPPLQILAAVWVFSVQGPLCARNFAAPRFAMGMMFGLNLPFLAGAACSHDKWLLCMAVVTPNYLYGCLGVIRRFQQISVGTMLAKFNSEQWARRDPLTGALNRFGLREILAAMGRGSRYTLFYLDLDGFKAVNDRLGHRAGDLVLQMTVERLRRISRKGDVIARPGGDEFVILALDMPPAAAEILAARLVDGICREPFTLPNGMVTPLSVSVGFACAPEDGTRISDLSAQADAALYAVKEQGKCHWRRAA